MPAAEADLAVAQEDERSSYEFAFHVLPTVAEGEVPGVFEEIKALISNAGGELGDSEAPERVDLAYEIIKPIEGKNRRFSTSYFGWVRFKLEGEKLAGLTEEIDAHASLLRYLIIKLTKLEEENPFKFHENRKSVKMVEVVEGGSKVIAEKQTEVEESAEVSEEALDESLDKITSEGEEEEKKEVAEEPKEEVAEEVKEEGEELKEEVKEEETKE